MINDKIENMMKEIPFGNSEFQMRQFTAGMEPPERRVRYHLLQLRTKNRALKEVEVNLSRLINDIEELKEIKNIESNKFEKRRHEIDIKDKQNQINDIEILIQDTLSECKFHYNELEILPEFSREDFEKGELNYWQKRLLNDAKYQLISSGTINHDTIRSLDNTGIQIRRDGQGQMILPDEFKKVFLIDKL